jgi:hypothetical protein
MTVAPLRFVYLMRRASDQAVKIGTSRSPENRRPDVAYECGCEVTLLGAVPGGYTVESYLHEFYADKRLDGEWFALAADDVRSILEQPLPEPMQPRSVGESAHRADERDAIIDAMNACGWVRVRAAARLGMARRTFYRRLHEYGIIVC